jgi:glycine amidinotransferase
MQLNTYEDWSPLREVIVGSARNYTSHERELSFEPSANRRVAPDVTPATESVDAEEGQ